MNVAYLILAHTDPPQLHRLINALDGEHASFFIHIDKKVAISPFVRMLGSRKNVRFLGRRQRITWGGFSVVQATLSLMREALNDASICDYFVLLSGQDYPIKSNKFLLDHLDKHRGREFINYVRIRGKPFLEWKINMFWPNERFVINRILHRTRRLMLLRSVQMFLFRRGGFPVGYEPCIGAQWWALTRECVRYILCFVEKCNYFLDFYRYVHSPDEGFFHTIVINSNYGRNCGPEASYTTWPGSSYRIAVGGYLITYFRGTRGHADVLDEADFSILRDSPCLFARKFSSSKSLRLIDEINRSLLDLGP